MAQPNRETDSAMDVDDSRATAALLCPRCDEQTLNLKVYEFPRLTVVLLLIFNYYSNRKEIVEACPTCLRKYMYGWVATSILTANFVWPIVVLPLFITRLIGSVLPGHRVGPKPFWKKAVGGFVVLLMGLTGLVFAVTMLPAIIGNPEARESMQPVFWVSLSLLLTTCLVGAFVEI